METRNFLYLARDLGFAATDASTALIRDTSRLSVKITNANESLTRSKSIRDGFVEYDSTSDDNNLI